LLSNESQLLGVIAVADTLKLNARKTIEQLRSRLIDAWMITGDNVRVADAIAKESGIKNVMAEVLPNQKAEKVNELRNGDNESQMKIKFPYSKYHIQNTVAFVGDGINDAPALASADVGIAMSTGSDIAIESAGVTILGGNLHKVVSAILLSKKVITTIKQNLFWAFGYNTLLIPLAAFNFLKPEFAAFAMAASSITVVGNSLRLKRVKFQ
jgi:Cu+-exporting ATPase